MKTTITTKSIKDINDKDLLYLVIENERGEKVNINVGAKTIEKVTQLLSEKPAENKPAEDKTTIEEKLTAPNNKKAKELK